MASLTTTEQPAKHTVIRIGDRVWVDLWRVGLLSAKVIGVGDHSPTGDPNDVRPTPLLELAMGFGRFNRGDVLRRGATVVYPGTGWREGYLTNSVVHESGHCHEWEPCDQCGRVITWGQSEVDVFVAAHRAAALNVAAPGCGGGLTWDRDSGAAMDRAARLFYQENRGDLACWFDPGHAGYDLWMSRTGGGVGFWARCLPNGRDDMFSPYALRNRRDPAYVAAFDAASKRLSDAAKTTPFGDPNVDVDDDGAVYVTQNL
jgi:hypothetical protein